MQDDSHHVVEVIRGDKDAFVPLMKKYFKQMHAYVRNALFITPDDAEDVVATVFAKAYTKLNLYDKTYAFSTWLYRIAHNECVDFIRKKKRFPWTKLSEEHVSSNTEYLIENQGVAQSLLKHVSEYERSILQMHYCDGMKYKEIGTIVDKNPGTVAVHILRAKQKLQKHIST